LNIFERNGLLKRIENEGMYIKPSYREINGDYFYKSRKHNVLVINSNRLRNILLGI
jgi:hypothetical protein